MQHDGWPKWRYHKDFPLGRIFYGPDEVPAGCVTNPADIGQVKLVENPQPNGTARDLELLGSNVTHEDIYLKPAPVFKLPEVPEKPTKRGRPRKKKNA